MSPESGPQPGDGKPSRNRRLAAILAADIAGYSRLMGEDEAAAVQALKAHQAVILPMIGNCGGRIIDTAGGGILAEFPSVVNATECAVGIQTVMALRNEVGPAEGIPGARFVPLDGRDPLFLENEPAFKQFLERTRSFMAG